MSRGALLALIGCLCTLAQAAAAEDLVYRCGIDGRSYSHEPCPNGARLDVADARSGAQVAQAQRIAQRDARLADAMSRQRQQAEGAAARQGPVLIGTSHRVAQEPAACRPGSPCARGEHSKQRRDKPERVTLYRAPEPR